MRLLTFEQGGWDALQLSQRAALRAILVSNSIFPSEAPMHDSPQSHRILSSDTAALWLLGLAFTAVHFVAGARYGFHRDELLTYSKVGKQHIPTRDHAHRRDVRPSC
jgi:hypothetical protein